MKRPSLADVRRLLRAYARPRGSSFVQLLDDRRLGEQDARLGTLAGAVNEAFSTSLAVRGLALIAQRGNLEEGEDGAIHLEPWLMEAILLSVFVLGSGLNEQMNKAAEAVQR